MIKHRFFQLLKKINIEILLIFVLLIILVALLFYNNAKMENMTINIYADSKGYKINEVKEEEDTSNVKPYTKNKNDASDYPSEFKEVTPNIGKSKSGENTNNAKKTETKETKETKEKTDDAIANRTSKYINTFTGPITAEPPPP